MFWGLILKGNRKYTQTIKKAFHLSHAALDVISPTNGIVQVVLASEKQDYILCTLKKDSIEQVALDLNFEEGEEISFTSRGEGNVHLSGYFLDDMSPFEDEDMEMMPVKKSKKAAASKEEAEAESDSDENGEGEDDEDDDSDDEDEDAQESDDDDDDDDDSEDDEEEVAEPLPKQQKLSKPKENGIEKPGKQKAKKEQVTAEKPKVEKTLAGGVKIEDLRVGSGTEAKAGKKVQVYYEGRLKSNNKVFDSTKQGAGFKFGLGKGEVIKGWDIGVVGMKIGGKRRITCPPHMAYGAKGSPPVIPSNSTLVFEVELKNVQ